MAADKKEIFGSENSSFDFSSLYERRRPQASEAVKPDRKWIKPELSGREKIPKQHQHRCEQPENRKNRGPPISRKEASPEKYCFGEVFRNK